MWQTQWHQVPDFLTQINWPDWLSVVATSSAVSSIVVLLMQGLRNRFSRRRERGDAALEVALSLEAYARACRAMIHRAEWARSAGEGNGFERDGIERAGHQEMMASVMLPPFLFPERIQWQRFSRRVVSDLRDFPARIHTEREELCVFADFGDSIGLYDEVNLASARAARDALALARETRKKNGCVPWRPGAKDADLSRELAALIARAEERRQARPSRSSATSISDAGTISTVQGDSSSKRMHVT